MVIVVRGACSVGKTSVARSLVHALPMSAHVDCGEMMPWMADGTLETLRSRGGQVFPTLLNEWLVRTAGIFDRQGIHLVVDWHFPADRSLGDLLRQFEECNLPCRVFNLLCSLAEHFSRDQQREKEMQIGRAGIEYFCREGSWVGSPYGLDLDTTALSPGDVAREIMADAEVKEMLQAATNRCQ